MRQAGSLFLVFWIPEYTFEDVYISHGSLFIDTCHAEDGVISQQDEGLYISRLPPGFSLPRERKLLHDLIVDVLVSIDRTDVRFLNHKSLV